MPRTPGRGADTGARQDWLAAQLAALIVALGWMLGVKMEAPTAAPSRVLVVDDDPTVSDVVRRYLERAGFEVDAGRRRAGRAGRASTADRPDLVVLDLMLPGIDGLEVCRRLRARDPDLPVVMLTALGEEADRVVGPRDWAPTTT